MSAPRPPGWRPRRREDVVFRRVGEEWLLFDPRTQRIHVLNLPAALVWSFCEGERSVSELESEVRGAFAADEAEAGAVRDALSRFAEEGLLEDGASRGPGEGR